MTSFDRENQDLSLPLTYEKLSYEGAPILNDTIEDRDFDEIADTAEPGEAQIGAVGIQTLLLTERRERKMAHNRFLRISASILHGIIAVATGVYSLYFLIGTVTERKCLPPLVDYFGQPLKFTNGLPVVCAAVISSTAIICALNIFMAILVNCCIKSFCLMTCHLFLAVVMTVVAVFGGTMFTVHGMLWCDSLKQREDPWESHTCKTAAKSYDDWHTTDNMTWYYNRLEIQQAGSWTIVPLLMLMTILYASAMTITSTSNIDEDPDTSGNFRYVILRDEATPLFNPLSSGSTYDFSGGVRTSRPPPGPPPSYQRSTEAHESRRRLARTNSNYNNPFETENMQGAQAGNSCPSTHLQTTEVQNELSPLMTPVAQAPTEHNTGDLLGHDDIQPPPRSYQESAPGPASTSQHTILPTSPPNDSHPLD